MAALDNTNKKDRFFQKVFAGKVIPSEEHPFSIFYSFLTIPRQYAPRWYHEGIASYVDTWMSGGIGEALGNYDEMFFRTKVIKVILCFVFLCILNIALSSITILAINIVASMSILSGSLKL